MAAELQEETMKQLGGKKNPLTLVVRAAFGIQQSG